MKFGSRAFYNLIDVIDGTREAYLRLLDQYNLRYEQRVTIENKLKAIDEIVSTDGETEIFAHKFEVYLEEAFSEFNTKYHNDPNLKNLKDVFSVVDFILSCFLYDTKEELRARERYERNHGYNSGNHCSSDVLRGNSGRGNDSYNNNYDYQSGPKEVYSSRRNNNPYPESNRSRGNDVYQDRYDSPRTPKRAKKRVTIDSFNSRKKQDRIDIQHNRQPERRDEREYVDVDFNPNSKSEVEKPIGFLGNKEEFQNTKNIFAERQKEFLLTEARIYAALSKDKTHQYYTRENVDIKSSFELEGKPVSFEVNSVDCVMEEQSGKLTKAYPCVKVEAKHPLTSERALLKSFLKIEKYKKPTKPIEGQKVEYGAPYTKLTVKDFMGVFKIPQKEVENVFQRFIASTTIEDGLKVLSSKSKAASCLSAYFSEILKNNFINIFPTLLEATERKVSFELPRKESLYEMYKDIDSDKDWLYPYITKANDAPDIVREVFKKTFKKFKSTPFTNFVVPYVKKNVPFIYSIIKDVYEKNGKGDIFLTKTGYDIGTIFEGFFNNDKELIEEFREAYNEFIIFVKEDNYFVCDDFDFRLKQEVETGQANVCISRSVHPVLNFIGKDAVNTTAKLVQRRKDGTISITGCGTVTNNQEVWIGNCK